MKKNNRILMCLVLTVLAVLLMPLNVFAADQLPDFDQDAECTVSVVLATEGKEPVQGADVTIYRVGDVSVVDGEAVYTCTGDFSEYAGTITDIVSQDTANSLFRFAKTHGIKGMTSSSDSTGTAKYSGLSVGVYLVGMINAATDRELTFLPFIASLPYADENGWVFNVTAMPKMGSKRDVGLEDLSVKKIWNDDGKKRPESVKIKLLCGGEEYETVTLDESNNWSYKWEDMDAALEWSVQEADIPDGYTVTYRSDGLDFTVYNSRDLPYTGQLKWPVPLLACGGLLFITAGLLVLFSSRKKDA